MLPKRNNTDWQIVSLGVSIPFLLGGGPIVGVFLGQWIGGYFGYPSGGASIGLLLGLISGVKESVTAFRRLMAITNKKN
jgi:hypothetical protein